MVVSNRRNGPCNISLWCVITTGCASQTPKCLSIHWPVKFIHARVCLCANACPFFIFSNVKQHVFLLRSKVNMKGLTTANMGSGFSFGVGRNLDSCSICTDQVRNWGSNCHFSTFYFILFCVHLHFQRWKCYFYCTFWYLFESNVLYGCIFTCLLDLQMSKSFQSSQIKQNLLSFLFVFLALKLIFVLMCWVSDASFMASD